MLAVLLSAEVVVKFPLLCIQRCVDGLDTLPQQILAHEQCQRGILLAVERDGLPHHRHPSLWISALEGQLDLVAGHELRGLRGFDEAWVGYAEKGQWCFPRWICDLVLFGFLVCDGVVEPSEVRVVPAEIKTNNPVGGRYDFFGMSNRQGLLLVRTICPLGPLAPAPFQDPEGELEP